MPLVNEVSGEWPYFAGDKLLSITTGEAAYGAQEDVHVP